MPSAAPRRCCAGRREPSPASRSGQKVVVGPRGRSACSSAASPSPRWASAPSYTPLFSNLAASDASRHRRQAQHRRREVPARRRRPDHHGAADRTCTPSGSSCPATGLPSAKNTGYSLLDQQGVTASQFQQQVAYQRAMEGELDNTIEAIGGVADRDRAPGHPAAGRLPRRLAEAQRLGAGQHRRRARSSPSEQVQSIVHLVSSSIEGMDSSEVTVVDGQGNLLSAAGDGTDGAVSADLASNERTSETDAVRQPGRVRAAVGPRPDRRSRATRSPR